MGFTKSSTPVTSADGDDREFGEDDGAPDGGRDFLCALDTKSDVAVEVADGDECLEAGTLAGTGLLLDGHDLHDLVLELGEEEVDDLIFLDGEREQVDLLHRLDLSVLYETAEFGDRSPAILSISWSCCNLTDMRTIPSPRPCDRHDEGPDGLCGHHHVHVRIHHVLEERQP